MTYTRSALLLCALIALCTASTRAQPAPPPSNAAPKPAALEALLPQLQWNVEQSGSLLIVAAGETVVPRPARGGPNSGSESSAALLPPGDDGYRLADLAELFQRKIVRCGSLHVLAPTQMSVLNDDLPALTPERIAASLNPLRVLAASFTPAQWRQFTGSAGIGAGDLSPEQKRIWDGLLPDTLVLRRAPENEPHAFEPEKLQITPITDAQRQQMRLSLYQSLDIMLLNETPTTRSAQTANMPLPPDRQSLGLSVGLAPASEPDFPPRTSRGQAMRLEVPAVLKPGDLPFDWEGLNPAVSLEDAPTVGDLVAQVAQVTGLELHCDPRYAEKAIHVRGTSARSGDVLEAVCHALTATWRKVGPAYVLTDDRVGLGTRHARIAAWVQAYDVLRNEENHKINAALRKPDIWEQVLFSQEDPHAPNQAVKKRLDGEVTRFSMSPGEVDVPFTELPAATQAHVRKHMQWLNEFSDGQKEWGDKVSVTPRSHVSLHLPGLPTLPAPFSLGDEQGNDPRPFKIPKIFQESAAPSGPLALTASLATRAVVIALPQNNADLPPLFDLARKSGFNEVWMRVNQAKEDTLTRLAQAITLGKARRMPVRAVMPVFRRGEGSNEAQADRTLLGTTSAAYYERLAAQPTQSPLVEVRYMSLPQSGFTERVRREMRLGNWLRPDLPDVQMSRVADLVRAARTPGLAGLVLKDLVPPGYDTFRYADNADDRSFTRMGGDLGYTEAARLDFLRKFHVDPVDLSPTGDKIAGYHGTNQWGDPLPASLTFFPALPRARQGKQTPATAWVLHRAQVQHDATNRLLRAVKTAVGELPLLVSLDPDPLTNAQLEEGNASNWYRSIDSAASPLPDAPPYRLARPNPRQPLKTQRALTHKIARQVLRGIERLDPASDSRSPAHSDAARVQPILQEAATVYDGFVADLSSYDTQETLSRIQRFKPASAPAKKPRP